VNILSVGANVAKKDLKETLAVRFRHYQSGISTFPGSTVVRATLFSRNHDQVQGRMAGSYLGLDLVVCFPG
jgi:hypothetical protein